MLKYRYFTLKCLVISKNICIFATENKDNYGKVDYGCGL